MKERRVTRAHTVALAVYEVQTRSLLGLVRMSELQTDSPTVATAVGRHEALQKSALTANAAQETPSSGPTQLLFHWNPAPGVSCDPALYPSHACRGEVPGFLLDFVRNHRGDLKTVLDHVLENHSSAQLSLTFLGCEPWERPSATLVPQVALSLRMGRFVAGRLLELLHDELPAEVLPVVHERLKVCRLPRWSQARTGGVASGTGVLPAWAIPNQASKTGETADEELDSVREATLSKSA